MPPVTTTALVLRLIDFGEADRIVTLLGRDLGKVAALARAARRSRRRFGPGLALFAVGAARLVERRGADLWRLESFDLQSDHSGLATDLTRLTHASYTVELLRELCPPHEACPAVFDLGVAMLAALSAGEPRPELLRVFELRLLGELGFAPALDRCAACSGDDLDHVGQVFDMRRGGVVCRRCADAGARGPALPASARQAFCKAQAADLAAGASLRFSSQDNLIMRRVALAFIQEHLGKPLKSILFLEKINAAR